MGLNLKYTEGQTPLDPDELEGLMIFTVATQGDLDEFEQQNIEEAIQWTLGKKFKIQHVFTEGFIRDVHKRMYKNVWSWAGKFRTTNKNIGVDYWVVALELRNLLEDVKFWILNKTYAPDEIVI